MTNSQWRPVHRHPAYFARILDANGGQAEDLFAWNVAKFCRELPPRLQVQIDIDSFSLHPDTVLKTALGLFEAKDAKQPMKKRTNANWRALSEEEFAHRLECDGANGWKKGEIEARLQQFGRNETTARRRMSEWKCFLLQFAQPLMYILLVASGVTFAAYCVVEFEKWVRRQDARITSIMPTTT